MELASNREIEGQTATESVDAPNSTVHKAIAVGVGAEEKCGQLAREQATSLLPVEVQHAGYSVHRSRFQSEEHLGPRRH